MRESQVEAHFVKRVVETGGLQRKAQWIARRGCPDRFVGWAATQRHAMVELKRPLGAARGEQEREHARLRSLGLRVEVLTTIEEVDRFVESMTLYSDA